jgi:hypothetical protein
MAQTLEGNSLAGIAFVDSQSRRCTVTISIPVLNIKEALINSSIVTHSRRFSMGEAAVFGRETN